MNFPFDFIIDKFWEEDECEWEDEFLRSHTLQQRNNGK